MGLPNRGILLVGEYGDAFLVELARKRANALTRASRDFCGWHLPLTRGEIYRDSVNDVENLRWAAYGHGLGRG